MPHWRGDGRALFYSTPADEIMEVSVETGGTFRHGTPVKLFDAPRILRFGVAPTWDVSSDGERFVFLAPGDNEAVETGTVTLVQGWPALID